jgi:UDP-2,3-diacylglucosamine hydrolase
MPLAQRKAIEGMRKNSQDANQSNAIMDVNADAIAALFAQTGSDVLIHGHTHRPALHRLEDGEILNCATSCPTGNTTSRHRAVAGSA